MQFFWHHLLRTEIFVIKGFRMVEQLLHTCSTRLHNYRINILNLMNKSKLDAYLPWPSSSLSYFKGPLFNVNAYPKGVHVSIIFSQLCQSGFLYQTACLFPCMHNCVQLQGMYLPQIHYFQVRCIEAVQQRRKDKLCFIKLCLTLTLYMQSSVEHLKTHGVDEIFNYP